MVKIIGVIFILFLWVSMPVMAAPVETISYTEEQLQQGEIIAQEALKATDKGDFAQAEAYWSQLVEEFPENPAVWSNRGNSRLS